MVCGSPRTCIIVPRANPSLVAAPSRLQGHPGSLWVQRIMMSLTEVTQPTT